MTLAVDRAQIEQFVNALFPYAESGTFASLRSFDQFDRTVPPIAIEATRINGTLSNVVDAATAAAQRAADHHRPTVFAPPVCTFTGPSRARGVDLANGVAISVELDDGDTEMERRRLESLLGPATMAVASGGDWTNPDTGQVHPKLHLHWRLSEPTSDEHDHARLRQARELAALLSGADPTAAPIVHPLRWPGSWNRKGTPRLARIVASNDAAEVHLCEAFEQLQAAVEARGLEHAEAPRSGTPEAAFDLLQSAMAAIPNPNLHYDAWVRFGYAVYRATGGSDVGFELWKSWSRKSEKFDAAETETTWQRIARAIEGASAPRTIGAGTIFLYAARAGWKRPERAQPEAPPEPPPEYWQSAEAPPDADPEPPPGPDSADAHQRRHTHLLVGTPADAETEIPQRIYIVPNFIQRGVLTEIVGPGGHGKSQLFLAWGVALALGVPFGGFAPPCPMRVATLDVEDDLDEQRRRVAAVLRLFGRSTADLGGRLLLMNPARTGMLLTLDPETRRLRQTGLMQELLSTVETFSPDLLMLNPLGELHDADENDNSALRHVTAELRVVAKEKAIGLLIGHHTRKGIPDPGNPDAGRGASSVSGVVRKSFTLYQMTDAEAASWKIARPGFYFRLDGAKANHDARNGTEWFERIPLLLDNLDVVAAAWPWQPPHEAVTDTLVDDLLAVIKAGDHGQPWSRRLGKYDRSISRPMERLGLVSRQGQEKALDALLAAGVTENAWTKPNRTPAMGLRHPCGEPNVPWQG